MPFLLAEILNFQGLAHLIGVGSFSLLDVLSEVGLFLSIEQINIADRAFGNSKNRNEDILINYYKKHLVKI